MLPTKHSISSSQLSSVSIASSIKILLQVVEEMRLCLEDIRKFEMTQRVVYYHDKVASLAKAVKSHNTTSFLSNLNNNQITNIIPKNTIVNDTRHTSRKSIELCEKSKDVEDENKSVYTLNPSYDVNSNDDSHSRQRSIENKRELERITSSEDFQRVMDSEMFHPLEEVHVLDESFQSGINSWTKYTKDINDNGVMNASIASIPSAIHEQLDTSHNSRSFKADLLKSYNQILGFNQSFETKEISDPLTLEPLESHEVEAMRHEHYQHDDQDIIKVNDAPHSNDVISIASTSTTEDVVGRRSIEKLNPTKSSSTPSKTHLSATSISDFNSFQAKFTQNLDNMQRIIQKFENDEVTSELRHEIQLHDNEVSESLNGRELFPSRPSTALPLDIQSSNISMGNTIELVKTLSNQQNLFSVDALADILKSYDGEDMNQFGLRFYETIKSYTIANTHANNEDDEDLDLLEDFNDLHVDNMAMQQQNIELVDDNCDEGEEIEFRSPKKYEFIEDVNFKGNVNPYVIDRTNLEVRICRVK